jgi:hypothetical protein
MANIREPSPDQRYVYIRDGHDIDPRPGLGFMLIALALAFFYAYTTRRALIIDWRDTVYRQRSKINLFNELFDPPGTVMGVPIIVDGIDELIERQEKFSIDISYHRGPLSEWRQKEVEPKILPWSEAFITSSFSDTSGDPRLWAQHLHNFPLASVNEKIIDVRSVAPGAMWGADRFHFSVPFLKQLQLRDVYVSELEIFRQKHLTNVSTLGLHIRHGNGEQGHFAQTKREIDNLDRVLLEISDGLKRLEIQRNQRFRLLLCTDSDIVISKLRKLVPELITRPQWRPTPGTGGSLHLGQACPGGESLNAANALMDIYLLSYCELLLWHSNGFSYFPFAASAIRNQHKPDQIATDRIRGFLARDLTGLFLDQAL